MLTASVKHGTQRKTIFLDRMNRIYGIKPEVNPVILSKKSTTNRPYSTNPMSPTFGKYGTGRSQAWGQ